ncbi:hypothetical protein A1O7_07238 [Cladophialophora yegresii CBS 114405]|uniref:BTB domain-containing protein n=1 Tax=Cladophialophora yegresii CBS 114405 TaxID=1182544 RepID=W9WEE9_9EURO|nr:uncharacterized protein A1O7_07238 [Cladophialophora yegresii CBS 114405]EXJ56894.1 hypothetical protein A1O7_07238 [Cladophialophora yegresii CBS 114405]
MASDSSATASDTVINLDPNGDLLLKIGKMETPEKARQLRISTSIMTLVSPFFKAMLKGNFQEGQLALSETNPPTLDLDVEDVEAMTTLCQIIHHGRAAQQPVHLEHLVRVATLSDMYGCQSATASWFHSQLLQRLPPTDATFGEDIAAVIRASYLFDVPEVFYESTKAAVQYLSMAKSGEAFRAGLGDTLPEGFVDAVKAAQMARLQAIRRECTDLVGKFLPSKIRRFITLPDGTEVGIPDVCMLQSPRQARYISAVHAIGLWNQSGNGGKSLVGTPVKAAVELLIQVAEMLKGGEMCCEDWRCDTCKLDSAYMVKETAKELLEKTHGFCLPCVRAEGKNFTRLAGVKCGVHEVYPDTALSAVTGSTELRPRQLPY